MGGTADLPLVDRLGHTCPIAGQDTLVPVHWPFPTVSATSFNLVLLSRSMLYSLTRIRRACLGAVIVRLVTMPIDIFAGDWTFTSIKTALAFIAEVFFSVMNLLAPNLPIFFDQTSTGGLHFVPGNTPRSTQFNSSGPSQKFGSLANDRNTRTKHSDIGTARGANIELSRMSNMLTTSIHREQKRRTASFDSDAILVRRSVEVS